MSTSRVLLADDHPIFAEGVRSLLEPEFEVVGVVADGRELVAAARKLRPDVIVADVTMPSLNGIPWPPNCLPLSVKRSGDRPT